LSQIVFWWLVLQDLLPEGQVEQMLRQAIGAAGIAGEDHWLAAEKLAATLQSIQILPAGAA
jgi:hypothetical protein